MGAPFFNLVNIPLFLAPDLPDGRGAAHRLAPRLAPTTSGATSCGRSSSASSPRPSSSALGVGSALVAALAGARRLRHRHHRARLRARHPRAPAHWARRLAARLGGLLLRQNRRYGGFVVHLGILVIALGVTGSQAWSVQTETTLERGEQRRAGRLPGPLRRAGRRARSRTTSRSPAPSPWPTARGRVDRAATRPRSSTRRSSRRSPTSTTGSGFIEDLYLVLGDFARDGSQATVKVQVNRMVSLDLDRRRSSSRWAPRSRSCPSGGRPA